jgi:hypothetical protein
VQNFQEYFVVPELYSQSSSLDFILTHPTTRALKFLTIQTPHCVPIETTERPTSNGVGAKHTPKLKRSTRKHPSLLQLLQSLPQESLHLLSLFRSHFFRVGCLLFRFRSSRVFTLQHLVHHRTEFLGLNCGGIASI